MALGLVIQTLYFIVDLYFVGKLGAAALAGLSLAGNAMFLIFTLTQILNVGTATLISHAVGEKDQGKANSIFNQSMMISSMTGVIVCILCYMAAENYLALISQDHQTLIMGLNYLNWFIPCMALQFIVIAISAALRGTGVIQPIMVIQALSILVNILLTPILIHGWGTGHAMGIAGAGFASSISALFSVILLCYYMSAYEKYLTVNFSLWLTNTSHIKKIVSIGLPAGGEFFLMFLYMATIYWLIKPFGADAQASFGIGSRIMQSLFLPAIAIAFSAPAIAGQNFSAKNYNRVKETFIWTVILTSTLMALITLISISQAEFLLLHFSNDKQVLLMSVVFLQIVCWHFIPSGVSFTCSGIFQSLGNTWPALFSTAIRLFTFIIPAIWLSQQSSFQIEQLWYISVVAVFMQASVSFYLVINEFQQRLPKNSLPHKVLATA